MFASSNVSWWDFKGRLSGKSEFNSVSSMCRRFQTHHSFLCPLSLPMAIRQINSHFLKLCCLWCHNHKFIYRKTLISYINTLKLLKRASVLTVLKENPSDCSKYAHNSINYVISYSEIKYVKSYSDVKRFIVEKQWFLHTGGVVNGTRSHNLYKNSSFIYSPNPPMILHVFRECL